MNDLGTDLGYGHDLGQTLDNKHELDIWLAISNKVAFELSNELNFFHIMEKTLADGILEQNPTGLICGNCDHFFTGKYCPHCGCGADETEYPDRDPDEEEDRDGDDSSDNEDADDDKPAFEERQEKVPYVVTTPGIGKTLFNFVSGYHIDKETVSILVHLLLAMLHEDLGADDELNDNAINECSSTLNIQKTELVGIWNNRPFDQKEIDEVIESWMALAQPITYELDYERITCRIEKYGVSYFATVDDPYEYLLENLARKKRRIHLSDGQTVPASLVLEKKRQMKESLKKILAAVIEKRRPFLDAPDTKTALEILRKVPLLQKDIGKDAKVKNYTIARHAARFEVETHHGLFVLSDFFIKSATGGKTAEEIKDTIMEIVQEGVDEEQWYSDIQIAEILSQKKIPIQPRMVANYRRELGIPTYGLYGKLFYRSLIEPIILDFEREKKHWDNKILGKILNEADCELDAKTIRDVVSIIEKKRRLEKLFENDPESRQLSDKDLVVKMNVGIASPIDRVTVDQLEVLRREIKEGRTLAPEKSVT